MDMAKVEKTIDVLADTVGTILAFHEKNCQSSWLCPRCSRTTSIVGVAGEWWLYRNIGEEMMWMTEWRASLQQVCSFALPITLVKRYSFNTMLHSSRPRGQNCPLPRSIVNRNIQRKVQRRSYFSGTNIYVGLAIFPPEVGIFPAFDGTCSKYV